MKPLAEEAVQRTHLAFRPKTQKCYMSLFRLFVAFCIACKIEVTSVPLIVVLSYLEFLVKNNVSVNMICNHVSAIKAMAVLFNINYMVMEHPRIKYFIKALKINRPLTIPVRNIMGFKTLRRVVSNCLHYRDSVTLKAIFLSAFFGFFRLSNLVPHDLGGFDPSRHFTGGDVFFTRSSVSMLLKWSKTIQNRDQVRLITLPKLGASVLCPYKALKAVFKLYNPGHNDPLFQCTTNKGFQVMTDARVRKSLANILKRMHLPKGYFTFHSFRRSGASAAFNANVPVTSIKQHGTWTSDCVWTYIQANEHKAMEVSCAFKRMLAS